MLDIKKVKVGVRFRKDTGDKKDADDETSLKALADSIKELGLLHPIVVNEKNELIAGYRRLEACKLLKWRRVPTRVVNLKKMVEGEYAENIYRKDFTPTEKVAIMQAVRPVEREAAAQREKAGKKPEPSAKLAQGRTRDKVARAAGSGHTTMAKAEKVVEAAKKDPERYGHLTKEMDRNGKVDKVYKKLQRMQRAEEYASKSHGDLPASITLHNADFRAVPIADSSIDLIFTDPPYDKDSLPLYEDLAKLAARVLKEGGSLVTYVGHHILPDVLDHVKKAGLTYWWILAVKHTGASASVFGKQVFVAWKPLLWFIKGDKPATGEFMSDYIPSQPAEKALHEWEQSPVEAEHVIKPLTYEGMVVLDPFMGSGTTGVAALKLSRRFIGIEVDKETYDRAAAKLADSSKELQGDTASSNSELESPSHPAT